MGLVVIVVVFAIGLGLWWFFQGRREAEHRAARLVSSGEISALLLAVAERQIQLTEMFIDRAKNTPGCNGAQVDELEQMRDELVGIQTALTGED